MIKLYYRLLELAGLLPLARVIIGGQQGEVVDEYCSIFIQI